MAVMITYSASLPKGSNIVKISLTVAFLDTLIAILAGLMMFTFLFEFGAEPSKGPGLVFISMPTIFYQMGLIGHIFAILFFIALAFAGLTSAVSLLEPAVQYMITRLKWNRMKSTIFSWIILLYFRNFCSIIKYYYFCR